MSKLIYLTGGAACGKSTYALDLAKASGEEVTFIATATYSDKEMYEKIAAHKRERPKSWELIEVGEGSLLEAVRKVNTAVAIIDCITMFTSTQVVLLEQTRETIIKLILEALKAMQEHQTCNQFIIVSNEVGWGLIPEHVLGRAYRETLGAVNKKVMASSDEAILFISGFPLRLK